MLVCFLTYYAWQVSDPVGRFGTLLSKKKFSSILAAYRMLEALFCSMVLLPLHRCTAQQAALVKGTVCVLDTKLVCVYLCVYALFFGSE